MKRSHLLHADPFLFQQLKGQPHVVQLIDICEPHGGCLDEHICIVMEKASSDLFSVVEQSKLSQSQVTSFMCQIVEAVVACHELGIAHRDVKLENILVFDGGTLKLCDFDLACFIEEKQESDEAARGGSRKYAAPELFDDGLVLAEYDDMAADSWSCGIIWFILNARQFPWIEATKYCPMFCKHLDSQYPWPSANSSQLNIKMRELLCIEFGSRLSLASVIEFVRKENSVQTVA